MAWAISNVYILMSIIRKLICTYVVGRQFVSRHYDVAPKLYNFSNFILLGAQMNFQCAHFEEDFFAVLLLSSPVYSGRKGCGRKVIKLRKILGPLPRDYSPVQKATM
jgi:hypothetical protein